MFYAFILLPEKLGGGGEYRALLSFKKGPYTKKQEIQKIRFKIQVCGS